MKTTSDEGRASGRPRKMPSEKEIRWAGIGALEAGEDRFEALKKRGRRVDRKWVKAYDKPGKPESTTDQPHRVGMAKMVGHFRALSAAERTATTAPAATAAPEVVTVSMTELIEAMTPSAVPTPAMVLQARRNSAARVAVAQEFGLLTAEEVAEIRGSTAVNRSALASRWKQEGRLLAVEHHGRDCYPGFQFGEEGRPLPVVGKVVALLGHGWETALWFVAANPYLEDDRPVDRLAGDPAAVLAAAEREAELLEL